MIPFSVALHCKEELRLQGTTDKQYASALHLVKHSDTLGHVLDVSAIEVTKHTKYREWYRVKVQGASFRAIIESTATKVTLHLVLPRSSSTYDEVEALWLQHRSIK